jgi:hypothetical protein
MGDREESNPRSCTGPVGNLDQLQDGVDRSAAAQPFHDRPGSAIDLQLGLGGAQQPRDSGRMQPRRRLRGLSRSAAPARSGRGSGRAGAGEVAQFPDRLRLHQRPAQQPVCSQVGQPCGTTADWGSTATHRDPAVIGRSWIGIGVPSMIHGPRWSSGSRLTGATGSWTALPPETYDIKNTDCGCRYAAPHWDLERGKCR